MADGARHQLAQVLEDNFAITPDDPVFNIIRNTSVTIALTKEALTSAELRRDRQIATYRQGAPRVGGDYGTEVSMLSHNDQIEAALMGTWTSNVTPLVASDISFVAASSSILTAAGAFPAMEADEYIVVKGSTLNDGVYKVVTFATDEITVEEVLVDEAIGAEITVDGYNATISSGIERRSWTIERYFSDLSVGSQPYLRYVGCEYDGFEINIAPNAIITRTWPIVGYNMSLAAAAVAGALYNEAPTTDVIDSFTGGVYEDGVRLCTVTELTLTLANGFDRRFAVGEGGCETPIANSVQDSNCTGRLTAYFENTELLEKFVNSEASSLQFILNDGQFVEEWNVPRIFYTGAQPDVTGPGDITLPCDFQAVLDPSRGTNIVVNRAGSDNTAQLTAWNDAQEWDDSDPWNEVIPETPEP